MEASRNDRIKKIRQVIASYPEGTSFNELHRQTKNICARQTLANKLKVLTENGLIEKRRVGKQKILYKDTELSKKLADVATAINRYIEDYKTMIRCLRYLWAGGKIDTPEAVRRMLSELEATCSAICVSTAAEALKFKGRTRELIAIEVFGAVDTVFRDFANIASRDPELKSAFVRSAAEAHARLLESTKGRLKYLIGMKEKIDKIDDLELKSQIENLFNAYFNV